MKSSKFLFQIFSAMALVTGLGAGHQAQANGAAVSTSASASSSVVNSVANSAPIAQESLKIVPTKEVCMVNNTHFGRPQIPVQQGGKTYYGCCENCKKTLSQDAASRSAIDPVSKKSIDKAVAVIAAREDGSVVYFENEANFKKYQGQQGKRAGGQ